MHNTSATRSGRLGRRLRRWLGDRTVRRCNEPSRTSGVLVVEDDADLREALALLLGSEGIEVAQASNGREALQMLPHHPPRVIVLDLDMPVVDGIEFLATKRALWRRDLRSIPVLVMTCFDEWAKEASDLGARAVLRKPFRFDALLDRVDSALAEA